MITMARGAWLQTFPVEDLSQWIAFYMSQQARYPIHAETYADDVRALEALRQRGPL